MLSWSGVESEAPLAAMVDMLSEPEALGLLETIAAVERRLVGAPTLVEATAVVLARKGKEGVIALDALLARLGIEVLPMTAEAAEFARDAYSRYGRGVGAPGVLNYGEVLAYGVARAADEPLLFKGEDFSRTDIAAAR